jgi:hypothetical protein
MLLGVPLRLRALIGGLLLRGLNLLLNLLLERPGLPGLLHLTRSARCAADGRIRQPAA